MNQVIAAILHTPWWVYLVLVYLVRRGLVAARPRTVTLWKLALLPAVFLALDIVNILENRAVSPGLVGLWLGCLLPGAAAAFFLVRNVRIRAHPERWQLDMPGDRKMLPLILVTFAFKYAAAYLAAASPALAHSPGFLAASLAVSGVLTGMFFGRTSLYAGKFFLACRRQAEVQS